MSSARHLYNTCDWRESCTVLIEDPTESSDLRHYLDGHIHTLAVAGRLGRTHAAAA